MPEKRLSGILSGRIQGILACPEEDADINDQWIVRINGATS